MAILEGAGGRRVLRRSRTQQPDQFCAAAGGPARADLDCAFGARIRPGARRSVRRRIRRRAPLRREKRTRTSRGRRRGFRQKSSVPLLPRKFPADESCAPPLRDVFYRRPFRLCAWAKIISRSDVPIQLIECGLVPLGSRARLIRPLVQPPALLHFYDDAPVREVQIYGASPRVVFGSYGRLGHADGIQPCPDVRAPVGLFSRRRVEQPVGGQIVPRENCAVISRALGGLAICGGPAAGAAVNAAR